MLNFSRPKGVAMCALCTLSLYAGSLRAKDLLGAGATFPYPLYSKMFDVYNKEKGVRINYQSIGSGGGIRQLQGKTVDFGATDAFMDAKELEKADEILHVPMCLGAVVVTYNIPGNPQLKLTPEIIADMFLGKITSWNDDRIKALNPDAKLPQKTKVIVVHRSDGSGTTFIFTDYLSKISSVWQNKVGRGKSVKWPGGLGAKGNEGVAGLVKQMPGSIGYCELAYTIQNKMPRAVIRNKSGNFVEPTLESTSLAAQTEIPADTRISLTNTSSEKGYPIAGFTWIILYKEQKYHKRDKATVKTMLDLLWWMIHDGQKFTKPLDYAPLPKAAVEKAKVILKSVTYGGDPVLAN
ncbi:MAG: phosphate ABC transporter substrate-binding protein PstS [Chitinivibrionales bacterium]|nr:phosphate ABC transporter substrate-binding protein PstS [Chitinivibrionales bacterium]